MYVHPSISRGFGLTTSQTIQTAGQIAAAGATLTTSLLTMITAGAATGGPVGAAIGALIAIGISLAKLFSGCGQVCVQATQYANQVESQILQPNLNAYINSPIRTTSMQAAAVNTYNTAIAALEQACGQASLGSAGQNCIDQRVNASSCQWKASPGGWSGSCPGTYTGYGASGSGSTCVNWVVLYLDPIQNDPCVQDDSVLTGSSGSSVVSGVSSSGDTPLLLIAGLLLAAFLL